MKKRNIIYIVISIICVISLIAGIVYEISKIERKPKTVVEEEQQPEVEEIVDLENIKKEFFNIFDNSFDNQGYSFEGVQKIKGLEDEDIIYSAYTVEKEELGKYKIDLNLPVFNIAGDVGTKINGITQSVFVDKANAIIKSANQYTIYNIDYKAYLNDNILSLIIKATLKEGENPQRLLVQTYNYDIKTGKQLSLNEVLQDYEISYNTVNKKIEEQVKEANKQAQEISKALGQTVYQRDINNAMYVTDNVGFFFVGLDGDIYIVYPYGNSSLTSEIDVIKI